MKMKKRKHYSKALKRAFEKYRWWDFAYMLAFEKAIWQDWSEKYKSGKTHAMDYYSKRCVLISKIALSLIEIYEGSWIEKEDPNDHATSVRNENGTWTVTHFPKYVLQKGIYVNPRNAYRFLNIPIRGDRDHRLSDVRCQKAWYLYNKLRYHYLQLMWD